MAALYDIHGNLPALEAVLADVHRASVDHIVVGGDVVPGPMPRETLARLLDLDVPMQFIHGNGERVVLAAMSGGDISEVPETYREVIRWTAQQLNADQQRALSGWPATCRVDIPGLHEVLFCHATPRNDMEIFTRVTPEAQVAPMFAGVTAATVVCGHTHMQFDRTIGGVRVVNAGSVGMPFAAPQGAYWLLLGPDVKFQRTSYDFEQTAALIRATGFPLADGLAVRYVCHPPTEEETLALYAGRPGPKS